MNDLFGQPVNDLPKLTNFGKPKRNEKPRGYAAPPGSGPAGQFCKNCRHFVRKRMSKTYFKCWLRRRDWSNCAATDIQANSPACMHWASEAERTSPANIYAKS